MPFSTTATPHACGAEHPWSLFARSFWQRLNALFFYTLSVLGFLAFMAAASTYFHKPEPVIELKLERILL